MSNKGFGGNGSRVGSVIMVNKSWPTEHELACFYDVSVGNVPTRICLLSSHLNFTFFFTVGLWKQATMLKEENVFIFSLEINTVSAFHRVVCCTWSLSRCLLCGLPRRWKLHVFKSLIFNVSQSIKDCFFISNWLLLIAGLLPELLALPSVCSFYPPARSTGWLCGFFWWVQTGWKLWWLAVRGRSALVFDPAAFRTVGPHNPAVVHLT